MTAAAGTFAITAWDAEPPYDAPADGPPLARITVRKAFSGPLEGASEAQLLVCAEAGYLASERVRGHARRARGDVRPPARRHGSARRPPFMFGNVVPGSGTGELAGLRGTVRMEHERYTLDYELG